MDPVSASVLGTWISKFYKYLGYYQTVTGFLGDDQVKNMLENIGDVHYEAAKKAINNRHYTEARANLYAAQAAHEKIIGSKGQVLGFKVERSDSEKEEIYEKLCKCAMYLTSVSRALKDDEAVKKFSDEARTYFNKYQDLRYEREKLPTSERYYTYEYMGGTSAPRRMEWTRSKKQIEENKRKNDSLIQKRENERRELDETLQGIRRLNAA